MTRTGVILTPLEWNILKAIPSSLSLKEVSKKSNASFSYVSRIASFLRSRGQISFLPNFRRLGLKNYVVILDEFKEEYHFLREISHIWGLFQLKGFRLHTIASIILPKEEELTYNKVRKLFGEDGYFFEIENFYTWDPSNESLMKYDKSSHMLKIDLSNIDQIADLYEESIKMINREEEVRYPDKVDIEIISDKLKYAYTKLSHTARRIRIPRQQTYYHFRKHVINYWTKNYVILPKEQNINSPTRVWIFEGPDASKLAFALSQFPFTLICVAGNNNSIIVHNTPLDFLPKLYENIGSYNVNQLLYEYLVVPVFLELDLLSRIYRESSWKKLYEEISRYEDLLSSHYSIYRRRIFKRKTR